MAINVVPNYEYLSQTLEGAYIRKAKLVVTGLAPNAANIVPHGLPSRSHERTDRADYGRRIS